MALRRHCKLFKVFRFYKELKTLFELGRENIYRLRTFKIQPYLPVWK